MSYISQTDQSDSDSSTSGDTADTIIRCRIQIEDVDDEEDLTDRTVVPQNTAKPKGKKMPAKKIQKATKAGFKPEYGDEPEPPPPVSHLSGLASHNVSVGEEDANHGTEDALAKFEALSIHPAPKPSGNSVSWQPGASAFMLEGYKSNKKSPQKHPTYITMIRSAIEIIDPEKGASIVAIKKWIRSTYPEIAPDSISSNMRRAIKKGMEDETLKRPSRLDALGSSMLGRIALGKGKGLAIKPKPQKRAPKAKKTVYTKSEVDGQPDQHPEPSLPSQTKNKAASRKPAPPKNVVEEKVTDDETLDDKENKSPPKDSHKKPGISKKVTSKKLKESKDAAVKTKGTTTKKPKDDAAKTNVTTTKKTKDDAAKTNVTTTKKTKDDAAKTKVATTKKPNETKDTAAKKSKSTKGPDKQTGMTLRMRSNK